MKKGFTLIELLAVIIVLAVIALITTPIVLNVVENAKEKANEQSIRGYATAVEYKRIEELFKGNTVNDDDLTSLEVDTKGNEVNCSVIKFSDALGSILYDCNLENSADKYCLINNEVLKNEECDEAYELITRVEPNVPDLLTNMIPIKYENNNWVYADSTEEWYDYDEKEWANAVVLKSGVTKNVGDTISESDIALWYVWIPRYKYLVFNGNNESVPEQIIDITFESGTSTTGTVMCHDAINQTDSDGNLISEICTDSTQASSAIVNNVSTYTHPAFCLGTKNDDGSCNGDELTGFWFGKFEISGTEDNITVIPNVTPLVDVSYPPNNSMAKYFVIISRMNDSYGIKDGDSHMVKNMEWGAVAYLKQSKYGLGTTDIGINNYYNSGYKTGCGAEAGSSKSTTCNAYNTEIGMLASTTGNIYGVYDMSGGAMEYVMGNMVSESGSCGIGYGVALFSSCPESKYYDAYTYDTSDTSHARGKLGDATKETLKTFGSINDDDGWYGKITVFPSTKRAPWFLRGDWQGIFGFCPYGVDYTVALSRAVLSRIP